MILPNGHIRKFVKTTIGLIIILVIINPFIKVVQGDIDIEEEVLKNIEKQYNYKENDYSDFENNQDKQVKEMYTSKIETEIQNSILNETKYKLDKTYIELNENKESHSYGNIEKIKLILSEEKKEIEASVNAKEKVEIATIDINLEKKPKEETKPKEELKEPKDFKDIKDKISKKFELRKDKVSLNLNTKE